MNKEDLIKFEKEVFDLFNDGKVKGVIHLSGSEDSKYEEELIKVFENIKKDDWVFSNHRNHYHILLKAGKKFCKKNILNCNSMHQYSKKHKVFTSGIVGGQIPIALGVALGIKLKNQNNHVWCFLGDMASTMGTFNVCLKYAEGFDLPITFIIEDNKIGCYSPTEEVWGKLKKIESDKVIYLNYDRIYPHHGTNVFIEKFF